VQCSKENARKLARQYRRMLQHGSVALIADDIACQTDNGDGLESYGWPRIICQERDRLFEKTNGVDCITPSLAKARRAVADLAELFEHIADQRMPELRPWAHATTIRLTLTTDYVYDAITGIQFEVVRWLYEPSGELRKQGDGWDLFEIRSTHCYPVAKALKRCDIILAAGPGGQVLEPERDDGAGVFDDDDQVWPHAIAAGHILVKVPDKPDSRHYRWLVVEPPAAPSASGADRA